MCRQKVIVIGGGLGGLFTGALLTKEGYEVMVIEKNHAIGGGLQTFIRGGMVFETGMHILGGLRKGGSVYKICNYLGILDQLRLKPVDADCMDSITYLAEGRTYRIPEGRDAFTTYLIREFPDDEEDIRRYVEALYKMTDEIGFFHLRTGQEQMLNYGEQFLWSASEFIAHYIHNERLRDLLAYMNPMYGGVEGHTPAYVHALINVLYMGGTDRFVGGSGQLADALAGLILGGGGRLVTGETVTALHTDGQHNATKVTTSAGKDYVADLYVSAIHPSRLADIADKGAFSKAYRSRIAAIPNSYSAFSVYIKFKPRSFAYINHTCYLQEHYGQVWHHADCDEQSWPRGFMFMTPPDEGQGVWATKMVINTLMHFSEVERWKDTTVGHRGYEYAKWKKDCVEKVLARMEQLYPDFRSTIDELWASSPLTIRDYYNQPEGALYGIRKDCKNIVLSQIPIWTKVHNLLLTGQNINLHGICGVPLTAVNTVDAIIGMDKLVEKINLYNNTDHGKN